MTISITRANLSHLPAIQQLNRRLFEMEFERYDQNLNVEWPTAEPGTQYFTQMIAAGSVYVAITHDEVVGYLAGNFRHQQSYMLDPVAELDNILVAEPYRGQGIGTQLVERFLLECQQQNIKAVRVTAYANNNMALEFYRKHGFAPREINLERTLQES